VVSGEIELPKLEQSNEPRNEQRTTNNEQRTTNNEQRATNNAQRTTRNAQLYSTPIHELRMQSIQVSSNS